MNFLRIAFIFISTALSTLQAQTPPAITDQSVSQLVREGETASFSVSLSGTAPFEFVWHKDGELIPGANLNSLSFDPVEESDTGAYQLKISNDAGSVASRIFLLDVTPADAPTVSINRNSYEVEEGKTLDIYSSSQGSQPLTFQWFKNGESIPGATSSFYRIIEATAADVGSYHVEVSNFKGSATSSSTQVVVTPGTLPRFANQPASVVRRIGETVNFNFSVAGSSPMNFELLRNGNIIAEADRDYSLRIYNVSFADEDFYRIRATNAFGEAYSERFRIIVDTTSNGSATVSVSGPTEAVNLGSSFDLRSSVSGSGTYSFQWLKNGLPVQGAQGSTLYVSGARLEDAGAYRLQLTQGETTISSEEIIVSVKGSGNPVISRHPADQLIIPGDSTSLYVNVHGGGGTPFTYQWFRDGEPIADKTSASLRVTDLDPELQTGSFTVRVSNASGTVLSEPAVVTRADPTLPSIYRHPSSQTIVSGNYASLSVSADSDPPPTYQWFREGTPLLGETNSTLSIAPNSPNYVSGEYHVEVTSPVGTVVSHSATITITESAAPVDWFIKSHPDHATMTPGQTVNLNVAVENSGSFNLSYQWYRDGEPLSGATQNYLNLPAELENAGNYHVEVSDGEHVETSAVGSVWVGLRRNLPLVTASSGARVQQNSQSVQLNVSLRDNLYPDVVIWRLDGSVLPQFTNRTFYIPHGANGAGTYTAEVHYRGEVFEIPPIRVEHRGISTSDDLVIQYHPRSQTVSAGADLRLKVGANNATSFQWFKDGEPIPFATTSNLRIDRTDTTSLGVYTVQVSNGVETVTSDPATVALLPDTAPAFLRHPSSLAEQEFQSYSSINVSVIGQPAPFLQWFRDGQPIFGATGNSYRLDRNNPAGSYHVVATNRAGSVQSATATVEIIDLPNPPTVTSQPVSILTELGNPAVFRATATGEGNLSFQWLHNGNPILGAEGSVYTINAVSEDDSGSYNVRVTNASGTTVSRSAQLDIGTPALPLITSHPFSRTVEPGASTLFSVTAQSEYPLTYQWQKNGVNIFNETNTSLTVENVGSNDIGLYSVIVSNPGGSVTSEGARLDLTPSASPVIARHRIVGNGYQAGETLTVIVRLSYSGSLSALGYQVLLPANWSFAGDNLNGTTVEPATGDTDLLEWAWSEIPPSPIVFEFTLNIPSDASDTEEMSALVESRADGEAFQALANPEPLIIEAAAARHTADTNQDGRFGLSELLRVIELYNTRHGSTRTGRYRRHAESVDGFAPDATQLTSHENLLARHHMADTDRNGHLGLSELLRVIELYNTREGTTRTGAYRKATDTVDGFEPGAGGE
ncbi:MAG: hypothetical protein SynsKO_42060 [Synoicihabitans sp.]